MVNIEQKLDRVFGALADPTRRAMIARLRQGETTVGDLAGPFDMSMPAITKHLNVLERAGLVTRRREGRTRICTYHPDAAKDAESWIADQTRFWNRNLDQLEMLLTEEEAPHDA